MNNYTRAFTHSGTFHADDVFSTVLIKHIYPGIKIERGNTVPFNYDGLVFDIGLGKYDHHQNDNETRVNGIQYAAFGKLWRDYGTRFVSVENAKRFDSDFVQLIDYVDNGGKCVGKLKNGVYVNYSAGMISDIIAKFNPVWDSNESEDKAFEKAVSFATVIFEKELEKYNGKSRAEGMVRDALNKSDGEIVDLRSSCPWREILIPTSAKFVIFPSSRGGFILQAVPTAMGKSTPKVPFPQRWLGKQERELSGEIEGFTFCHKGNFMASANTRKQARTIAMQAIKEFRK